MADTATEDEVVSGALLLDDDEVLSPALDDADAPPPDDAPPAVDDADLPPVPPDKDDGDGDDGKGDDDEPDEPEAPRPGVTVLNIVLFVLVFAAGIGFAFLMLTAFHVRHQYMHAVMLHDLALIGLPLDEEADGPTASRELIAPRATDPEAVKGAYQKRKPGLGVKESFTPPPDLVPPRITPQQLGPDTLKALFPSGEPVKTLQEEIKRLQGKLPGMIDAAAEEAVQAAKDETAKRQLLAMWLYSLCTTSQQVDALEDALLATKPGDLDAVVAEAARRKMIAGILAPFKEFDPSGEENELLLRLVELTEVKGKDPGLTVERFAEKTDKLREVLTARVGSTVDARLDSIDKRRSVAFLLFTLAEVDKPGPAKAPPPKDKDKDEPAEPRATLYPFDRAENVVGTYEITQAADTYAVVMGLLKNRQVELIQLDRGDGIHVLDYRIHEPEKFAPVLADLVKKLAVAVTDDKAKVFTKDAEQVFTDQKTKIKDGMQLLTEVKTLVKKHGLAIGDDKDDANAKAVKEATFDREVIRLLDPRHLGFITEHHEIVTRLRELAKRIEDQELRLEELKGQAKVVEGQYENRVATEKAVRDQIVKDRAATRRLMDDLAVLQQQLFAAQVELADADLRNQRLERRIRVLEKFKAGSGAP